MVLLKISLTHTHTHTHTHTFFTSRPWHPVAHLRWRQSSPRGRQARLLEETSTLPPRLSLSHSPVGRHLLSLGLGCRWASQAVFCVASLALSWSLLLFDFLFYLPKPTLPSPRYPNPPLPLRTVTLPTPEFSSIMSHRLSLSEQKKSSVRRRARLLA